MNRRRWTKIFRQMSRLPEIAHCSAATNQWWALAGAYAGLRPLSFPYTVQFKDGAQVTIADFFDLATFWPIFFSPVYPVEASDKVILDAGANVGMFTLYAARQAPGAKILAIEPFPSTFQRLQQVVSTNQLTGVTCMNVALGKETGEAFMPTSDMGSQFRRVVTDSGGSTAIAVPLMTLGETLETAGLDKVDLLKMDIEGGEYPTLLFSGPEVLSRIRRICLEYHPAPDEHSTIEKLTAHLENNGFARMFYRDDGESYGMSRFQNVKVA